MTIDRIDFLVPGAARPQGSKRHVGRGILVESSKGLAPWRSDVRQAAMLALKDAGVKGRQEYNGRWSYTNPWDGPVRVIADFFYRRPPSHYRVDGESLSAIGRRAPYPGRRGDVEKLVRAVHDALSGVVFLDDDQVVGLSAGKQWGPRDEARIRVARVVAGETERAA